MSPTLFKAFSIPNKWSDCSCSHYTRQNALPANLSHTLWEITIVRDEQFFISNALKFSVTDDKNPC